MQLASKRLTILKFCVIIRGDMYIYKYIKIVYSILYPKYSILDTVYSGRKVKKYPPATNAFLTGCPSWGAWVGTVKAFG